MRIRKKRTLLLLVIFIFLVVGLTSKPIMKQMYPIYHYQTIRVSAEQYKLDPLFLAAIIRTESKFQEGNVSHAGAIGLMQLMPDTARWIADQSGTVYVSPTELAEPAINIRLGSWYVAYLQKRFNGNIVAAVASYNAGPNRVAKWIQEGVWDGSSNHIDQIPVGETRHYVQRVLYMYEKYKYLYNE